jgi:hypothetical protein
MGLHLLLGHGAKEEPAHGYVPHALVIPPAVPAQNTPQYRLSPLYL